MSKDTPNTISDEQIKKLGNLLFQKLELEKDEIQNAKVKHILTLLAKIGTLVMIATAPNTARLAREFFNDENDYGVWKMFNERLLKQNLRRLAKQKTIDISEDHGKQIITITERGKHRVLSYAIGALTIKESGKWDGKWRLVLYDIPIRRKRIDKVISNLLKRLGFLTIQESAYIVPYPCFDEIEFLREYYFLGSHIKYFVVQKIEDEEAYKTYFGI